MTSRPQSQAVLRAILESPQDIVIFALDREYRYLAFNQNHACTIKHIWGVEIQVGDDMLALIGRGDDREKARRNFDRALAGESFTLVEEYGDERIQRRTYENIYSPIRDDEGNVIGLTVYLTDISERRRAEIELEKYRNRLEELVKQRTEELEQAHAQLLHAQKLESLGVLAGGIAHDFNNLLAVILGRAELSNSLLPKDSAVRTHLGVIHETAIEARMLTKQLLAYAGRGKFMVQQTTLSELVGGMGQLLRASVNKSIQLTFTLEDGSSAVEVDVTQLSQVVLNLVCNAAEAIGERPGTIHVRTRVLDVDEQQLKRACVNRGVAPGRYACLEVEDDGCGMDELVRSKLFDPFFTTKFSGRGLGLAAVLGIVTGHRGAILLRTAPGKGTSFSVLLPIARAAGVAQAAETAAAPGQARKQGVVLVVDDEEPVREVTCEVLESLGYEVLQAEGGRRACELLRGRREPIDLVLLDMTMPDMNGEQTLRELRAIRPDARVVLMTGYAEQDVQLRFPQGQLAGFLAKPFAKHELGEVIERAMHEREQQPS
jgi:two-component system cell cycle sensor histidine kinase/response regulator CckA